MVAVLDQTFPVLPAQACFRNWQSLSFPLVK